MSTRARPIAQGGFTMLETMLLVLIAAILIAVVAPSYVGGKRGGADAEAKSLLLSGFAAAQRQHFDVTRKQLLRLEPRLRGASGLHMHARKRGFALELRSSEGRIFSIRRTAKGRIERRCGPTGRGCRGGRW